MEMTKKLPGEKRMNKYRVYWAEHHNVEVEAETQEEAEELALDGDYGLDCCCGDTYSWTEMDSNDTELLKEQS